MRYGKCRRSAGGFTYLGVLMLVALLGLMLALAGQVVSTATQRERERELLFVGHAYRQAIGSYFLSHRRYPVSLEQLLGEEGPSGSVQRYLRQLYIDPMTRQPDWTLLPAPDGGIAGVASTAQRRPLKNAGFDDADAEFALADTYADWKFLYQPMPLRRPRALP